MSEERGRRLFVVCVTADTPHVFDDDVEARCALCGAGVYHRPHVREDLPGAVPICQPCWLRGMEQQRARGEVTVGVTPRILAEVRAELARRRGRRGR